ncbi:class I SAM-dependent methyltransferase [Alteribacter keqinensis]|uniref:Class I SAM-dependent methyltransferase n=1 Tax=Alteribacter keqinensis TaxID=2483800 RepID=A0A3M7TYR2_9BACI|nr:class I SAM-dependent methyltransferase [Alteribacter keqinensis]RNA69934.1 class I SAM-dependent methyltransferase [Alteribacter keqinensis]
MNDEVKRKVIDQFGKNAEKYVTSETHAKGEDLPVIVEWLNPSKKAVALDIATGGGHAAKALSPFVSHLFATDLTKDMLSNTARHLKDTYKNISFVIADAEELPFLDGTFDVVTCRIAPHHFPNPNAFVREVARVLKPGGAFLMIDNVVPEDHQLAEFMNTMEQLRDTSHNRCLSVNEWRMLFSSSGLEELQSNLFKKTYTFPAWVERTTESEEQIRSVYDHILHANKDIQSYFQVKVEDDTVTSVSIDEWMVLCRKK